MKKRQAKRSRVQVYVVEAEVPARALSKLSRIELIAFAGILHKLSEEDIAVLASTPIAELNGTIFLLLNLPLMRKALKDVALGQTLPLQEIIKNIEEKKR